MTEGSKTPEESRFQVLRVPLPEVHLEVVGIVPAGDREVEVGVVEAAGIDGIGKAIGAATSTGTDEIRVRSEGPSDRNERGLALGHVTRGGIGIENEKRTRSLKGQPYLRLEPPICL